MASLVPDGEGRGAPKGASLAVGAEVVLRAHSELHREPYRVTVLAVDSERVRVSAPMQDGRIVLLPVGIAVSLESGAGAERVEPLRVVARYGGPHRSLELARARPEAPLVSAEARPQRAPIVCVASGKGGVGTSVVTANLAALLARAGLTVCAVDAAPGAGNLHILMNASPRYSLSHVVTGRRSVFEAAFPTAGGVLLLAGGPDVTELSRLSSRTFGRVLRQFEELGRYVDVVLVDAGTGVGRDVVDVFAMGDERVVVSTPEPHAITDAYALLNAAAERAPGLSARLVLNCAGPEEGAGVGRKMVYAAGRFLGVKLTYLGAIPRDRAVERSVLEQELFVLKSPRCSASVALQEIGWALLGTVPEQPAAGRVRLWQRLRALWSDRGASGGEGEDGAKEGALGRQQETG